jgi:hypothetical protein
MLKSNGKYAESNEQMKTFAALKPNDKRAQEFNENPNYLAGLMGIKKDFTINKISVNSERSDFELFFMMIYFILQVQEMRTIYWME